jgi:triacylglycerol lipase
MHRHLTSLLALAFIGIGATAGTANAANNYPIVLVHGFLGFGPEQFTRSGFKYWGGFGDIAGHMRTHRGEHAVFATSVGSISSNWDRTAELYYQIKGGCVDYGDLHTTRFQHVEERRPAGKCWAADPANNPENYPLALYPAWDAQHPIHLFGHSQGGQTVRSLIQLLEHGSPHGDEGGGELYKGGKVGWVISATTISAPHDGTSLRDAIGEFAPMAMDWAALIAKIADPADAAHGAPDLKLEQFGVRRESGETGKNYLARAQAAPVWNQDNFDSAQWEMGPDGAQEFNKWVRTSPNVYYFSIANSATEAGAWCCNHTDRTLAPLQESRFQYPRQDMAPLTKPYAGAWIVPSLGRRGLGSYTQSAPDRVPVDSKWFVNDGVVNTASMRSPQGQPVRNYDGRAVRGVWNFLREYKTFDHFDVLGWPRSSDKAIPIYDEVTDILYAL